ncbi:MAG: four helix bundle protein [Ferruginibacter sp.]
MGENIIVTKSYAFSVKIVKFCFDMQTKTKEYVLSRQSLKSGTSIGANIEEAQGAISKPEFISKIQISLKEAKESKYWIRLIIDTGIFNSVEKEKLLTDCTELIILLTSILKTAKSKA